MRLNVSQERRLLDASGRTQRRRAARFAGAFLAICVLAARCAGAPIVVVSAEQVDAAAAEISQGTFAFGPKITDRAAWERLAHQPEFAGAIARAERLAGEPIPPLSDDLFLEFSRTGNRVDYEKERFERTNRLAPLVIGECIEHRGRFIPAIETLLAAFAAEKTWMLPAHDGRLTNFHGDATDIDLFSSALACDLASAKYLLGDALNPAVRQEIDENVRRRVLDPFRDMVTGKRPANGWVSTTNNWNAVCLANVLGAALATLPGQRDRALFVAAAEQDSQYYLDGFNADGFCVEGLGYWNYGFGNYIRLCELLDRTSGGRIDCFDRAKVKAIASYPQRLMIVDGVYPAYGDAHLDVQPFAPLVDFVTRRYGLPGKPASADVPETQARTGRGLSETLMFSFPNSATTRPAPPAAQIPLHDWFPDAQVLTCRPGRQSPSALAVSIKGGHNGVSHGHNDLGSFVLVIGTTQLLTDPGGEIYTARTFSKDRYKSKLLNSFGHNVPFVAGQLQISTSAAQARILDTRFTDAADTLAMDLTSAYAVPELRRLTRAFTYSRSDGGSLTIRDEADFSSPQSFGINFITFGRWKQTSPTQLLLWQNDIAAQITFDAGQATLHISAEEIDEDIPGGARPTHIGVNLDPPSAAFRLTSFVTPSTRPTD